MPLRRTSLPGALALLPLLASLPACGGEGGGGSMATVRDSAGVRIVESQGPAWAEGEGWRLSAAPSLDIGVAEGDPRYQFGRVAGALRLGDGMVVVADGQSNELRFFDRAGRHVRTVGRRGGGPGEFQGLFRLLRLPGDSVGVWDHLASRLSYFSPRGDFVRSATIKPAEEGLVAQVEGVFPDGSLLVTPLFSRIFRQGESEGRDTAVYLRYSAAGAVLDTLGRFPGAQTVTVRGEEDGGWMMRSNVPFGLNTFRAVRGGRVYVGDNARFEVAVLDTTGRRVGTIRRRHEPQPLTPEEIARYKERQLAALGPGSDRTMSERTLAVTPFPKTKSAFSDLLVDRGGAVWVREHPVADGGASWAVFAPGGELLGSVSVPPDFRVTDVGHDYVLGVWTDELDVQHVRLHTLEKRGAAAPAGGS